MNKPLAVEGRWWIWGDNEPPCFGVLTFDPETGLELIARILQDRTSSDVVRNIIENRRDVSRVIHGTDADNKPVTLYGCSYSDSKMAQGLDTYRIASLAGLLNYRGGSWDESRFTIASVKYSLLHVWMGKDLVKPKYENGVLTLKIDTNDPLDFEVSTGVHLKIEGTCLPKSSLEEYGFEMSHRVWFVFPDPRVVEEIRTLYVYPLLRLLSLLTGERVFVEELAFYDRNPLTVGDTPTRTFKLLSDNRGVGRAQRNVHPVRMIAGFTEVADSLSSILKRWFERHEQLEPVLDLWFAVLADLVSPIETRFLFLAQALEVYHARSERFSSTDLPQAEHRGRVYEIVEATPSNHRTWLKEKLSFSNQRTLAQRIQDILSLNQEESAKLLNGIDDFAAKVRHTRNYFTHYAEETRKSGKVAQGEELARITYALQDLLQVCLLKELGVTGRPIQRILQRHSGMHFVNIGDKDPGPSSPSP